MFVAVYEDGFASPTLLGVQLCTFHGWLGSRGSLMDSQTQCLQAIGITRNIKKSSCQSTTGSNGVALYSTSQRAWKILPQINGIRLMSQDTWDLYRNTLVAQGMLWPAAVMNMWETIGVTKCSLPIGWYQPIFSVTYLSTNKFTINKSYWSKLCPW